MLSQLPNLWWGFVLLGVAAGVLSGLLGLGSGIILIPALVLVFGCEQKNAQGMALAIMVPMALVGALRYWKNPEIEMNAAIIGLIVVGALAGALAGTELAARVPGHILRKIFAVVLLIVAAQMFIGSQRRKQARVGDSLTNQKSVDLVEHGDSKDEAGKQ